jgi:hypothetical protein
MPVMTLMFLASILPFRFPLLNLCVRDRNHALCQLFETLKWRFGCWRDLGRFHAMKSITQDLERNVYKSQPPTVAIIKSARNSLPQSIE